MKIEKVFFFLLVALLFSISSFTTMAQETAEELYEKGKYNCLAGYYDLALEQLNRSIELDPTGNPEAYFWRAVTYESLGRPEDAAADYLKSCELGSVECPKYLPNTLFDLQTIPKTTWAVADFGYHIGSQGDSSYGPGNVFDGRPETAWVTNDDPSYIFEDRMIGFQSLADNEVSEFTIRNGYCKSADIWEKNSRVKELQVLINNERVAAVTLSDTMDEQTFSLGEAYEVKADDVVSFLILDVYPGTTYNDIAISELRLDYEIAASDDIKDIAEIYTITKKFDTGGEIFSPPAAWDKILFIIDSSDVLYAVDTQTGRELWRFDSISDVRVLPPCVSEGIVYFGDRDGALYALDAHTGREVWQHESQGVIEFITCSDTGVVCFDSEKNIHAVDAHTDRELWRFETDGWTRSSPTIAGDVVYFGSTDGNLYAVDVKTGTELWRFTTTELWFSSPSVAGGAVYFGDDDGIFYSVDIHTGQELWRFQTEGSRCYSPVVAGNIVYFVSGAADSSYDDVIYALDTHTGEPVWKRGAGGNSPVYINGAVYLAGEFGVSALNAETGEEIWAFDTEFIMCTDPIAVDGVMYFGCEDGYLYAVE